MILVDASNFKKEVLDSKTPVIVDFYADWCGPCQMLGPVLEELSKDADFKGKLKFAKLDTEQYPEMAEQFNVSGIPCLVFVKGGKEASRIVGFAPRAAMKTKITSALQLINK